MSRGAARRGAGLVKSLVILALVAGGGVLVFATLANWRRSGELTFHVFDGEWWSNGRDEAQPLVDTAKQAAGTAFAKLWGEGGVIDQADKWLHDNRGNDAKPTDAKPSEAKPPAEKPTTPAPSGQQPPAAAPAKPAAPAPPGRSAEARRYEDRLTAARAVFEDGVAAYHRANPAQGGWTDEKKQQAQHAKEQFGRARDLLSDALPAYEALPDHDAAIAQRGRELQHLDQQLFYNANKMCGGF